DTGDLVGGGGRVIRFAQLIEKAGKGVESVPADVRVIDPEELEWGPGHVQGYSRVVQVVPAEAVEVRLEAGGVQPLGVALPRGRPQEVRERALCRGTEVVVRPIHIETADAAERLKSS